MYLESELVEAARRTARTRVRAGAERTRETQKTNRFCYQKLSVAAEAS